MKRVFIAAVWCHSDRMVAKDVIITLIAGIGKLIGMTSFKSSGPTCSQITKETKSWSFYSVRRPCRLTFNIAFETGYNTHYFSTCYLFLTLCPPSLSLLHRIKRSLLKFFFHCSVPPPPPPSLKGGGEYYLFIYFWSEKQPLNWRRLKDMKWNAL